MVSYAGVSKVCICNLHQWRVRNTELLKQIKVIISLGLNYVGCKCSQALFYTLHKYMLFYCTLSSLILFVCLLSHAKVPAYDVRRTTWLIMAWIRRRVGYKLWMCVMFLKCLTSQLVHLHVPIVIYICLPYHLARVNI